MFFFVFGCRYSLQFAAFQVFAQGSRTLFGEQDVLVST